ncbi:DUF4238 domain-containing protein [Streptomyces sp. NPDC051310]|uniref:DUF4238 domain-containing protein n=1 Tax=Streptomyces sp. NPDC051310 TaxID=3365649 RepID=UPI0037B245DE
MPTTAAYLRDFHWTLFRFDRRSIATSDHPVTLRVAPDHPKRQGAGIATAGPFLVPLSRRAALTIQPRRRFPQLTTGVERVPDFAAKGTTAIAKSINQETAARARKYVYHHPGETPLERLYLPNLETRDRPSISNTEGLIREEGLFSGMTDEARRALSVTSIPGESDRGMSVDDIPWPIPGRRARSASRPTQAGRRVVNNALDNS